MPEPRIYQDQPLSEGSEIRLDAQATQHVARVLRMQPGERIHLFNGQGQSGYFDAELIQVSKREVIARLERFIDHSTESPLQVELGQVISRGDRMDFSVQKSTELGVHGITPLFSERCEVRLKGERLDKKQAHWQQVAISACEQCGRNQLPTLHRAQSLAAWLEQVEADIKLVLHHRTAQGLQAMKPPQQVAMLIGPEGGLTPEEIALAESHGFQPLALGPRVMRTETAAPVTLGVLQYLWGDFG